MNLELLQTSNSFPYAVALAFKGTGADALNTCGRAVGERVAVTVAPGESVRCSQSLYAPDSSIRSSHFKDYAHCKRFALGSRKECSLLLCAGTRESIMSDIVPFSGKPWCYVPSTSQNCFRPAL